MSRGSEYPDSGRRYEDSGDDVLADVLNGFSLDSRRKRKRKDNPEPERAEQQREQEGPGQEREQGQPSQPEPVERNRPEQQPPPQQPDLPRQQDDEPEPQEQRPASSVRSYTWTGGRTRSSTYEFQLETLVSAQEAPRPGTPIRLEHQSIVDLCRGRPRSVAEVGALLSVPVGVTRVLLADMAELGLITVHQTVSESGSAPNMVLMERVLSGLRRL